MNFRVILFLLAVIVLILCASGAKIKNKNMQKLIKCSVPIVLFIALILCMSKTVEPYCEFTEEQIEGLQLLSSQSLSYINDQSPVAGQGVMGFYFDSDRLVDDYGIGESKEAVEAVYNSLSNWKGDSCNGKSSNYIGFGGANVVPAQKTNDVLSAFNKRSGASPQELTNASSYCQGACSEMALGYEDLGEGTNTYNCIVSLRNLDVFNDTNGLQNFSEDILEEALAYLEGEYDDYGAEVIYSICEKLGEGDDAAVTELSTGERECLSLGNPDSQYSCENMRETLTNLITGEAELGCPPTDPNSCTQDCSDRRGPNWDEWQGLSQQACEELTEQEGLSSRFGQPGGYYECTAGMGACQGCSQAELDSKKELTANANTINIGTCINSDGSPAPSGPFNLETSCSIDTLDCQSGYSSGTPPYPPFVCSLQSGEPTWIGGPTCASTCSSEINNFNVSCEGENIGIRQSTLNVFCSELGGCDESTCCVWQSTNYVYIEEYATSSSTSDISGLLVPPLPNRQYGQTLGDGRSTVYRLYIELLGDEETSRDSAVDVNLTNIGGETRHPMRFPTSIVYSPEDANTRTFSVLNEVDALARYSILVNQGNESDKAKLIYTSYLTLGTDLYNAPPRTVNFNNVQFSCAITSPMLGDCANSEAVTILEDDLNSWGYDNRLQNADGTIYIPQVVISRQNTVMPGSEGNSRNPEPTRRQQDYITQGPNGVITSEKFPYPLATSRLWKSNISENNGEPIEIDPQTVLEDGLDTDGGSTAKPKRLVLVAQLNVDDSNRELWRDFSFVASGNRTISSGNDHEGGSEHAAHTHNPGITTWTRLYAGKLPEVR